jgi:hypothetical protein
MACYGWSEPCRIILLLSSLTIVCGGALAQDEPQQPASPPPGNSQPEQAPRANSTEQTPQQQAPQQQSPQEPGPQEQAPKEEKKDEGSNPAQMAAEKTVQAAVATKNLGEAALLKARDWESGWVTGVYVEEGKTMIPLSLKQRREIYLEQTLTTPGAYMKRMFAAGIDQARGVPSQWDDGWDGYVERFASREGQFIAANTLAYLGNVAMKYEPRYDQCRCTGFWPRTRHAIMRNFLTYNETEQDLRPQWALYGGSFGGGLLSTAWKPHPRNGFAEGGRAMLGQAGYGALLNFFIEFSTDINRTIGAHKKARK